MRCVLLGLAAILMGLAVCHAENIVADNEEAQIAEVSDDMQEREARARGRKEGREVEEKAMAITDPQELSKYNSFVDALIRRLGVHFRSRSDPLTVRIVSSKKSKTGKKTPKKAAKSNKKKTNKKTKGKKKTPRHPKNLNPEGVEEDDQEENEEVVQVEEQENDADRVKRDIAEEEEDINELLVELDEEEFAHLFEENDDSHIRVTRDAEEELDEEEEEEIEDEDAVLERVAREAGNEEDEEDVNRKGKLGKGKKGKAKSKKGKKKSKGKGKGKGKKRGGRKTPSKSKKSNRKPKKSKSSNKKSGPKKQTPRVAKAAVSGFGTISRFGDVSIVSKKESREIRSTFRTGPVSVKVSRTTGKGKTREERNAKATTSAIQGKLVINVNKNGRAAVSKVSLEKPTSVLVDGSLGSKAGKSDTFMKRSIGRMSPIVAKKIKFAARDILRESSKKKA